MQMLNVECCNFCKAQIQVQEYLHTCIGYMTSSLNVDNAKDKSTINIKENL